MRKLTYASAFAGFGGMTLGLSPIGYEGVIAWEYDPSAKARQYAQEAHRLLHPEIPVDGDICGVDTDLLPDFDVFCFTPPCQAFSISGRRGGFEDTRGTLTFNALQIAKDKQPSVLFMENVKGLVSHDKGRTFTTVLHAMNDIGYVADFKVLNSNLYGVPQNRERVYVVAFREDLVPQENWKVADKQSQEGRIKTQLLSEGFRSFNFNWPQPFPTVTAVADILEHEVDERYYYSPQVTERLLTNLHTEGVLPLPLLPLKELKLRYALGKPKMVGEIDINGHDILKRIYHPLGHSSTVTTAGGGNTEPKIFEPYSPFRVRKLTARECLRLQAVPEDVINKLAAEFSSSRLYKFAGNGLTINVIRAIGENIKPYLI